MRWTKKDSLDLEGLAMPKGFSDPEALAQIKPLYEACLKNSMFDMPISERLERDGSGMKAINECIYNSCIFTCTGVTVVTWRRKQLERMRALFGFMDDDECYAWIDSHDRRDPEAGELLIQDALSTGEWWDLPDELQPEYHKRKGDIGVG